MRPFCVVVMSPLFDDDFGLLEAIEDFSIEQFVPEFSVKALVVAVFPGAAGFDEQGLAADLFEPVPNDLRSHFRPVI